MESAIRLAIVDDHEIVRMGVNRVLEGESGIKLIMERVYDPGVLDECYHIAQGYRSQACLALEQLPSNPFSSLLVSLTDQVITRTK